MKHAETRGKDLLDAMRETIEEYKSESTVVQFEGTGEYYDEQDIRKLYEGKGDQADNIIARQRRGEAGREPAAQAESSSVQEAQEEAGGLEPEEGPSPGSFGPSQSLVRNDSGLRRGCMHGNGGQGPEAQRPAGGDDDQGLWDPGDDASHDRRGRQLGEAATRLKVQVPAATAFKQAAAS